MRILFFGDIVGKIGRKALAAVMPGVRNELHPDVVIVNGENMAHGLGITRKTLEDVLACGVDAVTTGNHIGSKEEFQSILEEHGSRVLRPANYPPAVPGRGVHVIAVGSRSLAIVNLMGRVFMHEILDCPFRTFDALMQTPALAHADAVVVDFHAEATSEKNAFGWHADGRVHTEGPLRGFLTQLNGKFEVIESGMAQVNGVVIDIDPAARRATAIQRFDKEVSIG